jgi:hypothetical protein
VSSDGTTGADDSADDTAERFAAAVDEHGDGPGEGDPDLAREVAIAHRLGALGTSLDPDPEVRERARRRLLAALAREAPGGDTPSDGPSRAS